MTNIYLELLWVVVGSEAVLMRISYVVCDLLVICRLKLVNASDELSFDRDLLGHWRTRKLSGHMYSACAEAVELGRLDGRANDERCKSSCL